MSIENAPPRYLVFSSPAPTRAGMLKTGRGHNQYFQRLPGVRHLAPAQEATVSQTRLYNHNWEE